MAQSSGVKYNMHWWTF